MICNGLYLDLCILNELVRNCLKVAAVGDGTVAKLPGNPVFKPTSRKETINRRFRNKNMHTFKLDEEQSNYEFFLLAS